MEKSKRLLALPIAVAVLAAPAMARKSHVGPQNLAYDANASVSPTVRYINGPVGIRVPRVRTFGPAPSDGGTCDVGDNARVC
ncbi:MAG TPA: hypothetical protein VF447_12255 [Terriglobales bacterium]